MTNASQRFHTLHCKLIRRFLHWLSRPAFVLLTDLEINGTENLPEKVSLIMVVNHFSFINPVCFVRLAPWEIEFIGGADMPHAPLATRVIPFLWGYHPLYHGTGEKDSLKAVETILQQGGILGIFPNAGNWATVLSPAPEHPFLLSGQALHFYPSAWSGLLMFSPASSTDDAPKSSSTSVSRSVRSKQTDTDKGTANNSTRSVTRSCVTSRN